MSTRLLSFLTEIEQALTKESISNMGPTWEFSRMVNYQHGLARMTVTPPAGAEPDQARGAIFLQSFTLADGSLCLKASLNWVGSDNFPVYAVYSKPQLDWKSEASRIASAWLAGPTVANVVSADTLGDLSALEAVAS